MSGDVFTVWVNFVLEREGGLTDDKNDPGGLTNFGIDRRSHPDVDIRALTRDQAIEIYRQSYWLKSQADKLPPALAVIYADSAVNQGLGAAARLLQTACGVGVNGIIGPATLAALVRLAAREAANGKSLAQLVDEFASRRAVRYADANKFASFDLGWMRRLMACHTLALSLIPGKP